MEQEDNEIQLPSPNKTLPVLPRLDRLDLLVQFLEEKHSLLSAGGREEDDEFCKSLSLTCALEEVQHKGTLMERLEMLEKRVLQLSLEIDMVNFSRSSLFTAEAPQKSLDSTVEAPKKEDEPIKIARQEKMDSPTMAQESVIQVARSRNSQDYEEQDGRLRRRSSWYKKWVGCMA